MKFDRVNADHVILKELGVRLARYRLNRNMTQEAFAEQAGVSRPTIARLEQGSSTNLTNLIRVLRALDLVENLESLVPEPPMSPMQQLKMQKKQRQRASSKARSEEPSAPWTWGDEG